MPEQVLPSDTVIEFFTQLNSRNLDKLVAQYNPNGVIVTAQRTYQGHNDIRVFYSDLLSKMPDGTFTLMEANDVGPTTCRFTWSGDSSKGTITEGEDTVGVLNNKLEYHSMVFTYTSK